MKNAVKGMIGLGIFGAGFGAGWLVAKSHYIKALDQELEKINKEVREEINALKVSRDSNDLSEKLRTVDVADVDEFVRSHDEDKDYTAEVPKEDPFAGMTKEEIEEARSHHRRVVTDYASMYKPSLDELAAKSGILQRPGSAPWQASNPVEEDEEEYEDAETDEEREIREGEALGRVDHVYPYIIEPEQFDMECEHYDKIDIFYYAKDDTLCDEDDTPIDDYDNICGDDALMKLEMQTKVYVRNEKVGADYAIHRLNRSYKEDILGLAETPNEREYRHLARRKSILDGDD